MKCWISNQKRRRLQKGKKGKKMVTQNVPPTAPGKQNCMSINVTQCAPNFTNAKILYFLRAELRPKKKYVCFLFHPVKSLGRVGRLSFFFNFFYNLILTTNIQHTKVAHNLEHRSGISRHVV